jgi:YHS domain-containing protein
MRSIRNALIPLVAALAFAGCASNKSDTTSAAPAAGASAINSKCCCGKPLDGKSYATYNGQTVGFCSAECVNHFNAMTDEQKKAELAKAAPAKADHPKSDHPKGEHPK